jgi:16S rRNA (guanine966-N2)-methyltransferase
MRVVGGKFRSAPLVAPAHMQTRPTSDRVREAIFNILRNGVPCLAVEGARVLDLFAGSGALGIEALSRGAVCCVFVEIDAAARAAIRRNIEALGLTGATKVFRRDATDLGPAGARGGAHLVFLDPPYGRGLAERALAAAAHGGWLANGARVVLEEHKDATVALPHGFALQDRRTWGETQVMFAAWDGLVRAPHAAP